MVGLEVGSRVHITKEKATIRYVGSVAGQEGTWVGVEWDNPARGKHDGSTGGVRYFECNAGSTAGSFIRLEKVPSGCHLLQALQLRYQNAKGEQGEDVAPDELYVPTAGNRKVQILLVGEDKIHARQKQIQMMTSARLVDADVAAVGCPASLQTSVPHLTELDLTSNLISSWDFLLELGAALPALQILNLSSNHITLPPNLSVFTAAPSANNLKHLILNGCGVTWQQMCVLQSCLPHLKQLHMVGCGISSLAPPDAPETTTLVTGFTALQGLVLEDNVINQWEEVERLRTLPALKRLHLSGNPLPNVTYPVSPSEDADNMPFSKLEVLLLGSCQITEWSSVDELDKFPVLHETRLSGNPFLANARGGGRYQVIARISKLTWLNGAEVKPRERHDSDLRYLHNIAAEIADAAQDPVAVAAVHAVHPRLKALVEKYGPVMAGGARADAQSSSMASSAVVVKLTCVAVSAGQRMGTHEKKLPATTTVAALRLLCEKLFKVPASVLALYVRSPADPLPESIGDDETAKLSDYGVQNGWEIMVDEFDPEEKKREEATRSEAERVRLEASMAEQLRQGDRIQKEFASSMGI